MPSTPEEWADLVGRLENVRTVAAQLASEAGCNYEAARDALTEAIASGELNTCSLWGNVVLAATHQRNGVLEQQLTEFAQRLFHQAGLVVIVEGEAGGLFISRLTNDPCKLVCVRGDVRVELPIGPLVFVSHHGERFEQQMKLRLAFDRFCRFAQGRPGFWVVGKQGALRIPISDRVGKLSDDWRELVTKFVEAEQEQAAQPA